MRSSPSSSCSHSLSSCSSLAATSLSNRLETIFKKAYELSTLCDVEDHHHYSPDQISQLIQSLQLNYSKLQERRRFLEAQKRTKTNLEDHKGLTRPMSLNHQAQSLNPSKFSPVMYNHEDATLSQIPLSASDFKQSVPTQFTNYTDDYSAVEESGLKNHLMGQELYCCDQNMCMSDITNSKNFQHHCVSNTQDYSTVQKFANNYRLNQLMQQELHGYDQNMCMSDITNSNVLDPCLPNTVSDEFCSDFQDPYGCMVGNTSFSQDLSDTFPSYDVQFNESSLLQTSTLPSLYTIPNS